MTQWHEFPCRATRYGIGIWFLVALAASATTRGDDEGAVAKVEDCAFQADFDGSQQKYVLVVPPEFNPAQPVSLLIALHGHGSDRWQFVRQPRGECRGTRDVAAAHRMVLVSPDYRATTSWMGPAAEADLLQIIRTLKSRFKVRRVILCGGSMGGTGALTFTALHPELIDAVVALNGTANLVDYARFQDAIAESFGGSKEQVPHEYRKRSAEFFPTRFTMPLAATTGGQDATVPAESVLRLIDRAGKHNPNVLSIHRPSGGHSTTYEDTKQALEFVIAADDARRDDRARRPSVDGCDGVGDPRRAASSWKSHEAEVRAAGLKVADGVVRDTGQGEIDPVDVGHCCELP